MPGDIQMSPSKLLYAVVCSAGPARDIGKLVHLAQQRNWSVQIVSTPSALAWLDIPALEAQTKRPVRSEHRSPGSPRSPRADAIILAPASFNTINKLANGISDNYALDMLNEMMGLNVPLAILPFTNTAYFRRAPYQRSIQWLREEGVSILVGEGGFEPHDSGTGDGRRDTFPWQAALDAVETSMKTCAFDKSGASCIPVIGSKVRNL